MSAPKCLAIQPGVIDFPATCDLREGHEGRHHIAMRTLGQPLTFWEDEVA